MSIRNSDFRICFGFRDSNFEFLIMQQIIPSRVNTKPAPLGSDLYFPQGLNVMDLFWKSVMQDMSFRGVDHGRIICLQLLRS